MSGDAPFRLSPGRVLLTRDVVLAVLLAVMLSGPSVSAVSGETEWGAVATPLRMVNLNPFQLVHGVPGSFGAPRYNAAGNGSDPVARYRLALACSQGRCRAGPARRRDIQAGTFHTEGLCGTLGVLRRRLLRCAPAPVYSMRRPIASSRTGTRRGARVLRELAYRWMQGSGRDRHTAPRSWTASYCPDYAEALGVSRARPQHPYRHPPKYGVSWCHQPAGPASGLVMPCRRRRWLMTVLRSGQASSCSHR